MSQSQTFTHRRFCTQTLLHTDAFTHRLLYTQTLLHTEAFTHRPLYTQTLLHTDTFTHRPFYTQTLLHRGFYTQKLLHTDTFTRPVNLPQSPDFKKIHAGPYPQKKDVDSSALNAYLYQLEASTNRFASTSS